MAELWDHFACRRLGRDALLGLAPAPLRLQRVDHFLGHVALVMLGEHRIGVERAIGGERAFGHHPLPLAEEVGKDAGEGDRHRGACRR